MRIGIDILGGDHVPEAPISGVKDAIKTLDADTTVVLVGDQNIIETELKQQGLNPENFTIAHAPDVIGMDEHPARAITTKPNASINVGLQMVKDGTLDTFISAGNTGAMLVGSVIKLGNIPGVVRPTIGAFFPYKGIYRMICDSGANTDCKPEQLAQFAYLESIFMHEVMGVANPRVALLNIGEESTKGNQVAQATYILLQQQSHINFVGNAEGRDLNRDVADIYLCDGFTGNIVLKFGESFYPLFKDKFAGDADLEGFNAEKVGGIPILGVKGNVIIGHGISGRDAFANMIRQGVSLVRSELTAKITRAMAEFAPEAV